MSCNRGVICVGLVVDVSDDEGGFVTDSELEINRSTRYGSLVWLKWFY